MTACLLTVVQQLVSIVLNAILNANSFTLRTLITPSPSNSRLSCLRFRFFLLGLIGTLQIGFVFVFGSVKEINK